MVRLIRRILRISKAAKVPNTHEAASPCVSRQFAVQWKLTILEALSMAINPNREERLEARCTPEVKQQIEHAARLQGRSITDFMVSAAHEQACRVIEQQSIIKLSAEQSAALAEALLNPVKPNKKTIEAAKRYKKVMGI